MATTRSRPITRNTASCVPLQVHVGVVVQPAQGPASSLMNALPVMCGSTVHCMVFTRVTLIPLAVEALAAISRALSNHN
jgi:hypothetical protein